MSDTTERKILNDKMNDRGANCTLNVAESKHVTAAVSVGSSIDIFVSSKSYVRHYNLDHTKITRGKATDSYIGQLDNEIDDVTELITTVVEITSSLRKSRSTCHDSVKTTKQRQDERQKPQAGLRDSLSIGQLDNEIEADLTHQSSTIPDADRCDQLVDDGRDMTLAMPAINKSPVQPFAAFKAQPMKLRKMHSGLVFGGVGFVIDHNDNDNDTLREGQPLSVSGLALQA